MDGKIYLEYEKQKKITSHTKSGMYAGVLMLMFGFFLFYAALQKMDASTIVGLLSMYWIIFGVIIFIGSTTYFKHVKVLNEMVEKIKKVK